MIEFDYQPLNLYSNYKEAAEKFPETVMIYDKTLEGFPELGKQSTYEDSHEAVKNRAYQLAALGVSKGDKLIIYKSPQFDTYLLAVAASYLGAVPAMISYHLPTETIEVFVDRLENPFILFDDETANRVTSIKNSEASKQISVEKLLATHPLEVAQVALDKDEISYMTHTSGTTGIPKLICHSANSMGWRTTYQKEIFSRIAEKNLVAFHISPVHSRFNIGISSLMAMGFPMMTFGSSSKENLANMMSTYQPIAFETHPNNFVQWLSVAKNQPEVFASCRYFHSTFDAINNATMKAYLEASQAKNSVFLQIYGQSECGPMILKAHTKDSLNDSDARDMGVGLPGLTEARITNSEGGSLPANVDGNIHFLSKGRALTYYKEDERFQSTVYGKWWDSGDYGYIDDKGHLHLKDRQVDLIETIDSSLAIEDHLLDNLPFLEEVVLVRGKDNRPQPVIALESKNQMNWEAWWEQVADLPYLNQPILALFEDIPRTATMKVQRLHLEKLIKNDLFRVSI